MEKYDNLSVKNVLKISPKLRLSVLINFVLIKKKSVQGVNQNIYLPLQSFFFIRTKFIRMLSLNFGEILRTFLTLKLPYFSNVLKVRY